MTMATQFVDKSPAEMLYHWEKETPNKVFLRQPFEGQIREYTWKDVCDQARRMATAMQQMGIKEGDVVCITGKNTAHWLMADFASMMIGAVTVGLYPKLSTEHASYILNHCEAKVVFLGPQEDLNPLLAGIPAGVQKISFPYKGVHGGDHDWDTLVGSHQPLEGNPTYSEDRMWTLIYTSGTTGNPKGVALSGEAVNFCARGLLEVIGPSGNERLFSYLPLAHIFERGAVELFALYGNAEVTFLEDVRNFAKELAAVAPTRFVAVPVIWAKFQNGILQKMPQEKLEKLTRIPILSGFIKKKIKTGLGLQNSKLCLTGAAPIPKSTLEWFDKYLDLQIYQGWGMSENTAYATVTLPGANRWGSVGKPMPRSEVKIAENGEILTRSKANMMGYYKEPEKTAECIDADGWIHTGDKGSFDEDGFLYITGRVKDIFKTAKGKYIAPAPIEGALSQDTHLEIVSLMGAGMNQPVAIAVLSEAGMKASKEQVEKSVEATMEAMNKTLEAHEKVQAVIISKELWTPDNGMLTPTMKTKRNVVEERYGDLIQQADAGSAKVIWE